MTKSLKSLFKAITECLAFSEIAQTESEKQLQQNVIDEIREYFAAKRCGIFMFARLPNLAQKSKLLKLALSLEYNPILRYLMEHHAPVHEEIILPEGQWRTICPRFDHGHVMAGPIVNDGILVGGLGVTRDRNSPPFNNQDIADMSALSLHLSILYVKIQSKSIKFTASSSNIITPREKQIAELVAQGLTNAQIAKTIWITENSVKQALKRMFRKLNVSSRAEMIGKLTSVISVQ